MNQWIGMVVHYVSAPLGKCRGAVITEVAKEEMNFGTVKLTVFAPDGLLFRESKRDKEALQFGSWHLIGEGSCNDQK